MRLYHYVKADVVKTALNAAGFWVKASHPCEFNDPFECTGGVYGTPPLSLVEEFYATRPDQALVASVHGNMAEYVSKWLWKAFRNRKFLGQGHRISCFSDADGMQKYPGSDVRMWAHYANHGMGLRLEFDTEDVDFPIDTVKYNDKAPILDLSTVNHLKDLSAFIETCVVTKHKIWTPEQEVRIVFRGPNDAVRYDPRIKMYRWPLPLNCIVEIAVGETLINSSQVNETVRHIRKAIQGAEQSISIVAATRNYNTYGLDYTPITLEA